MISLKR